MSQPATVEMFAERDLWFEGWRRVRTGARFFTDIEDATERVWSGEARATEPNMQTHLENRLEGKPRLADFLEGRAVGGVE